MYKDREAFCAWKIKRSSALPNTTDFDAWVAATAAMREKCAKIIEEYDTGVSYHIREALAAEIRMA